MGRVTDVPATRDQERAALVPWRAWYNSARWKRLRMEVLEAALFTCQWLGCGRVEGDTALLVADHVVPHRGDEALFWDRGNLQCLCKDCHDTHKQRWERRGER